MIPLNEFESDAVDVAREYAVEELSYRRSPHADENWRAHLAFFEEALVNELGERAGAEVCS